MQRLERICPTVSEVTYPRSEFAVQPPSARVANNNSHQLTRSPVSRLKMARNITNEPTLCARIVLWTGIREWRGRLQLQKTGDNNWCYWCLLSHSDSDPNNHPPSAGGLSGAEGRMGTAGRGWMAVGVVSAQLCCIGCIGQVGRSSM